MKRNSVVFSVWIVVIGALLFTTGLGRVHLFDWDEINFAESAREMLVSGDYLDVQINFETFWEKPPLFIWMQAFSMKLFGVNEFAARFPNALAGIITLLVLFFIGKRLRDESFGLLWSLLYACSFLPFFYFKSGIIDPWFNLFIFLGIYFMIRYTLPEHNDRQGLHAVLSAFFLGLATLTKGPVGFLIFALCFFVFLVLRRFRIDFRWKHVLAFIGVFAIVGGLWFIL
ncbi:MAG TPA: glycosyl transferase, partial [Porphyromonadaceae bacterium]|nr:glycosyl transferase [Porphyromonadaceae bacterium]